jgi:glycosyltransferase involved in cell wall biosynthesis
MINYVSNLPADLRSGGFSAMNFAAWSALSGSHAVHYAGPVDPPASLPRKALSKLLRLSGGQGDFFFYSQPRLEAIAREVDERCVPNATFDFFHGFTPWILTRPVRPYAAWSDCTFRDYMEHFHDRGRFRQADLERIERAEAAWLRAARMVIFTSEWAAARARAAYGLEESRVAVTGILGDFVPPENDRYAGGKRFAFISTNFVAKGGPVVLEAFRKLRTRRPEITLAVVGDRGPLDLSEPGVTYEGFLRKEHPAEYGRLREIFATSRAIVNATRSDIAPVLLVEAGYFGCPAVSSRRFAIPEIVNDGVTGILVDNPEDPDAVAQAMARLLDDEGGYAAMRRAAWEKVRCEHSRARFERRLCDCVDLALRAGPSQL